MKVLKPMISTLLAILTICALVIPSSALADEAQSTAEASPTAAGDTSFDSGIETTGIDITTTDDSTTPPDTTEVDPGQVDDISSDAADSSEDEGNASGALAASAIESSEEKTTLLASANASFTVKLPSTLAHKSASLYYRAQGSGSWISGNYATDSTSIILSLPASAMSEGVVYEYAVSFLTPTSLTNIAANRVNKLVGTVSVAADGTWTHVSRNGEPTGLFTETKNADGVTLAVLKAPTYLQYKAKTVVIRTLPKDAFWDISLVDSLDGTPNELCTYASWGVTFYVASESANVTAAARTALAGAGYPVITGTVTDSGSNTIATADVSYAYSLSVPNYARAYGLYYPKGSGTDALIADPASQHAVTIFSTGMYTQFQLNLTQSSYAVLMRGLYTGTEIQGASPEDTALFTVSDGPGGKNIVFNVTSGTKTVAMNLVCPGLYTVPLRFTINADQGTLSFDNQSEAAQKCETLTYTPGVLDVRQMLMLGIVNTGSQVVASSGEVFQYIQKTKTFEPGIVARGQFGVVNPDASKSYRIVGYRVDPNHDSFPDLLRSNTVAIKKYFATYYPGQVFNGYEYLYNFETITGKTPSEALLEMYQVEYPGITSLGDLPLSVITHEILYDGGDWRFPQDKVDLSNARVIGIIDGSGYSVLETDPVMIELANKLLYEDSLSLTFDNAKYPLSPYLNATEELKSASDERLRLLYSSYRDRFAASDAMMTDIISTLPVLRPAGQAGDSITFKDFAFGVNGNYIHNPYRLSNYEVNFDFSFILSVVGIEGIAFVDSNVDGIWQDTEEVLANVEFKLYNPNGSLYGTYLTDGNGRYEIPYVPEGQGYYMTVTTPGGYELTSVLAPGDINGNSFKAATGDTDEFDIVDDAAYRYNAGFVLQANKHTVTYDPNGGRGTVVDEMSPYNEGSYATILSHTYNQGSSTGFSHIGFRFKGWNDKADGSGTNYSADETLLMDKDWVLYAMWEPLESIDPSDPVDPLDPVDPVDPVIPDPEKPQSPPQTPPGTKGLPITGDKLALLWFGAAALCVLVASGLILLSRKKARQLKQNEQAKGEK